MPIDPTTTIVRDNVFIKGDKASPDGDKPNLLVGDFPQTGPGARVGNGGNVRPDPVLAAPCSTAAEALPPFARRGRTRSAPSTSSAMTTGIAADGRRL